LKFIVGLDGGRAPVVLYISKFSSPSAHAGGPGARWGATGWLPPAGSLDKKEEKDRRKHWGHDEDGYEK